MMEYTLKLSHIFEQQYIEHRNSGRTKVLEKINKLLLELSTSSYKKQSLWKIKNDFLEKKKEKSYS